MNSIKQGENYQKSKYKHFLKTCNDSKPEEFLYEFWLQINYVYTDIQELT